MINTRRHIGVIAILAFILVAGFLTVAINRSEIIFLFGIKTVKDLQFAIGVLAGIVAVYTVAVIALWYKSVRTKSIENKHWETEDKAIQGDPAKKLAADIWRYIDGGGTTVFFRNILINIAEVAVKIEKQVLSINQIAERRFGADGLSYEQFVQPVNYIFDHLIDAGDDLVQKLLIFDEDKCQEKIDEMERMGKQTEAADYQMVMDNYTEYATSVADSFEKASVKMDMLILEIGKLSDEGLVGAMSAFQELDTVILNTKLYK